MRTGAYSQERRSASTGPILRSGLLRLAALALLWPVLTEGDTGTLWLGALAVVAATLASLVLLPPTGRSWDPLGVLRFAGFFLQRSLVGGIDVALRALRPDLDLDPAFVEYETQLPEGGARVLFSNTVSLLPGTLSAEVRDRRLLIHTLAATPDLRDELRRTEEVVARALGVRLAPEAATGGRT